MICFFSYLSNAKPDKINSQGVTQDYDNYGLRMVNIRNHINASKLMWLDRIIKKESTQIGQIVEHTIAPVSNFCIYGLHWIKNLIEKLHNQFWKEVCISWLILLQRDQSRIEWK